jgi:hypothetical protein
MARRRIAKGTAAAAAVVALSALTWACIEDDPDPVEPDPTPIGTGVATITGEVRIPPTWARNLAPQMQNRKHCTGMPEMSEAFERTGEPCESDMTPVVRSRGEYNLPRLGSIVAFPVRVPEDAEDVPFETEDGRLDDVREHVFFGTLELDGSYRIEVPPYSRGYEISVTVGHVQLKQRLPSRVDPGGSYETPPVDLRSTLIENVVIEVDRRRLPVTHLEALEAIRPEIDGAVAEMTESLTGRLRRRDWTALAVRVMRTVGLLAGDPPRIADASEVPQNLRSADDFIDGGVTPTTVTFDSAPSEGIHRQYIGDGVTFRPVLPARPGVAPLAEHPGGYLVVDRQLNRVGLDIVFSTPVRSVGMTLQNGGSRPDTTSDRRPFRMTALLGPSEVHEFRWYTHQGADAQFYGLTSPDLFNRVRVEMALDTASFTLDDLVFATDQIALDHLGWRAGGLWELVETETSSPSGDFDHFSRSTTGRCDYNDNRSGVPYWKVAYGTHDDDGCEGSCLETPAFTLSNLPLYDEDEVSFDYWISGSREGSTTYRYFGTPTVTECTAATDGRTLAYQSFDNSMTRISDSAWDDVLFQGSSGTFSDTSTIPVPERRADGWKRPGVATMAIHWSHVHWQSYIDIEEDAVHDDTDDTERLIEYSTDNGATWTEAWWYDDESHKGVSGLWWNNHMHPMPDSDLQAYEDDPSGCSNTDFDKDGTADFNYDVDGESDGGAVDGDSDDCRQWDTEFYMEVPDDYYDLGTIPNEGESYIEGTSMLYRFRFDSTDDPSGLTCFDSCAGWFVDDVALNNDDSSMGYYTNFEEFTLPE